MSEKKSTLTDRKCSNCSTLITNPDIDSCPECGSNQLTLLVVAKQVIKPNKQALRNTIAIAVCGIPAVILGILSIIYSQFLSGLVLTIVTVVIAIAGIIIGSRIFDPTGYKSIKRKWTLQNTNVIVCVLAIILAIFGFLFYYRYHFSTQFW